MNVRTCLGYLGATVVMLLLQLGCIDPIGGTSVSGTTLYAFDGATGDVLVWNDASVVYDGTTLPAPDRTISGNSLDQVKALGWGGMAMDPTNNRLFLVTASGKVARIDRIRTQSGALTSTNDIVLFTLGSSSERLSGGVFGQAAVDPSNGTLYVTETTDTDAHIWAVSNPGNILDGTTVPLIQVRATSGTDIKATGVAASQGSVYAYFGGGDNVINNGTSYSGGRIRKGSSSFTQVVVNSDSAVLGTTGSLGLDSSNSLLYVARRTSAGAVGDPPILVYKLGRFTSGFNQANDATLGTAAGQPNLRFITHAGSKDWLAGGNMVGTAGSTTILLWRNPSVGDSPKAFEYAGGQILGLALDGSN